MVGPDTFEKGGIAKVITGYIESGLFEKYNIDYFPTYKNKSPILKILFYIKNLTKILLKITQYDILHVHTASMWSFRRLAIVIGIGIILGKKIITHIHGGGFEGYYNRSNLIEKKIIIYILNKSDIIVVLSQIFKKNLSKITDTGKIKVVYNSVNYSSKNESYKREKYFNIIFLGSLLKRKGIYDLINAFHQLIINDKRARLILCGNGEVDKINRILKELKIEKQVCLPGWVDGQKKIKLIDSSHVLVLPSYVEAFPMSILEAMSRGVPAIATNVGGIEEIITDFSDGFIFNPGDIQSLTNRIELLYNDDELYRSMCNQAKNNIAKRFSTEKTFLNFEQLYSYR